MEDFKNTNKPVIREEIYDKIFRKDKLNIVYSSAGGGAGFICKSVINHLALNEDFQVIKAIDTEAARSVLRDLCDDVYALKRLQERTGHKLEKPILYFIDISDLNNTGLVDNIQRLFETNIIQSLNIWVLLKTTKELIIKHNAINFSEIKSENSITYIKLSSETNTNYIKLFETDKVDDIEVCLDFLSNSETPDYKNIINCIKIINDCCMLSNDFTVVTNLSRCKDFLSKLGKKLKEDYDKHLHR